MSLHGTVRQWCDGGLLCGLLLLAALAPTAAAASTVHAAVAANFATAMQRLAPAFEAATGHQLVVSHGATGQLYAQVRHGAPYDLLLAADAQTPARLVDERLASADTAFVYARGRLVLWSAVPGRVDTEGKVLRTSGASAPGAVAPGAAALAIANPRTAPYGQAALETLTALGLLDSLRPRFVIGANVAQTHQFIASGNVPLGFIALAQVLALPAGERGSYWVVPAALHRPIEQVAVLLRRGETNAGARAFIEFLRSPAAVAIIRELGYEAEPALPDDAEAAAPASHSRQ